LGEIGEGGFEYYDDKKVMAIENEEKSRSG
jgi:hypothetical protein